MPRTKKLSLKLPPRNPQDMQIERVAKFNAGEIAQMQEEGLINHNHITMTKTITVVTGVDFANETVTTTNLTYIDFVGGVA